MLNSDSNVEQELEKQNRKAGQIAQQKGKALSLKGRQGRKPNRKAGQVVQEKGRALSLKGRQGR